LKDPNITRGLREGWKEQQTWHRDLPETLPQNPKVDPQTRNNLLAERSANQVTDSIARGFSDAVEVDNTTRIQPARIRAGTALGIAGLALEVYDAAETYTTSNRLRSEGNDTAADSKLVHFGSRAVGGWAGFSLGFTAGALAGVETGPGLLVTGTIGGLVGTVAGDKFATWTDNQKIYNQNDGEKRTWTFDPENPSLGWRHKTPIDAVHDGVDNPTRGSLRASPALANELNYYSTRTSVEFVLGSPPVPRDPFTQPANAKDTASSTSANWTLDASSGGWRREAVVAYAERGLSIKQVDVVNAENNPARAAELNRAAAETLLQNSANTPAMIAARYEQVHIQNGWAAHGDVPKAVSDVRTNVDKLMGSDENLYQRNAEGKWVSTGGIYNSTASGNLHEELEATRAVLQAKLPPPQAIQAPPAITQEARTRDAVMGAYHNAGVTPSAERVADATVAVRATMAANGLDPNTTAFVLKPDANGHYGPNSAIGSLRLDADGKTYVIAAVTSAEEIQRVAQDKRTPASLSPSSPTPGAQKEETLQNNATPHKSSQLNHPSNSNHPFHSLFTQATAHVAREDERLGRKPDEQSERFSLAATALAADNGIKKIDHMVFSAENKERGVKAGENVIIVQGGLNDPAHERAHMKTLTAINVPAEDSIKQLDVIQQRQVQETQQQAQSIKPDSIVPRGLGVA
jgi:hypothetical protein